MNKSDISLVLTHPWKEESAFGQEPDARPNSQSKSQPLSVTFILKANQEEAGLASDGEAFGTSGSDLSCAQV